MNQIIPKGYKTTEIGIIPEDWEIKILSEICIQNGIIRGPFGGAIKKEAFVRKGYKVYTQQNAIYDSDLLGNYYITSDKHNTLVRFAIKPFDLIISCSGTIGRIHQITDKGKPGVINQALLILRINKNVININYFVYFFRSNYFQNLIVDNTHGGAMKNMVGINEFKKLPIKLPPLNEQKKIIGILSDIDQLIQSLKNLINKKRNIKTATMQQLLTGKSRLPEFRKINSGYKKTEIGEIPEDWRTYRIGDVLSIKHGKSQNKIEVNFGVYPILATGGKIGETNTFLYDKPSVLIGRKGTINKPLYIESPFWTIDTLFYSVIKPPHVPKFIFYKFCQINWLMLNEASGVPSLTSKNIENTIIAIPKNREQTAIAKILSDMDKEIETLEERLKKTKAIKQGMMQQLLTGKIRLTQTQVKKEAA